VSARARAGVFLLYLLVTLVALLWPQLRIDGPIPRPDLWIHFACFGLLSLLAWWSGLFGPRDRWRTLGVVLALGVAYGGCTELLQLIPALGRTAALDDWAADSVGVALGLIPGLVCCLRRPRSR